MHFKHTNRPGFWFGLVDFYTAGLFFLFYMPLSGLQDELDYIVGRRTQRYWVAYLLGIPTLFIYPLVWMARIAEELKAKLSSWASRDPIPPGGTCSAGTPSASCFLERQSPRSGSSTRSTRLNVG